MGSHPRGERTMSREDFQKKESHPTSREQLTATSSSMPALSCQEAEQTHRGSAPHACTGAA